MVRLGQSSENFLLITFYRKYKITFDSIACVPNNAWDVAKHHQPVSQIVYLRIILWHMCLYNTRVIWKHWKCNRWIVRKKLGQHPKAVHIIYNVFASGCDRVLDALQCLQNLDNLDLYNLLRGLQNSF